MAKLSNIFESIDHNKKYENDKRDYLAKTLVESYFLSMKKVSLQKVIV